MRVIKKRQSGFTLVELLITTMVIGFIGIIVSDSIGALASARQRHYNVDQMMKNQQLGDAMLRHAREQSALGTLPAPHTDAPSDLNLALLDPSDTTLAEYLSVAAPSVEINGDGTAADNVRVYQRLNNISINVPLRKTHGALVNLRYDIGAIHLSNCPRDDSTCNRLTTNGGGDMIGPGDYVHLDALNYSNYSVTDDDLGLYMFSTLDLQKHKLAGLVAKLDEIAASLAKHKNDLDVAGTYSGDNNFLSPTGASPPNLSGANPTTNEGCHDGWYQLNAANVNVLAQLAFDASIYGVTEWGGRIEYCRDYDPAATGTGSADTAPHYAALRIHTNVSLGSHPDGSSDVVIPIY